MTRRILILGGAGFIGSNLARHFVDRGDTVTVLDGLLEHTGGQKKHLEPVLSAIEFLEARIEDVPSAHLQELIARSDVVLDCMAWTSHLLALDDPVYDLTLNAQSHLCLLKDMPARTPATLIYLGSRAQYGTPAISDISEDTPMLPQDIQGIHKLTAEHYYRVYSALKHVNAISLRIPNCFGPNQPLAGPDIGLVGSFIRELLSGEAIELFGTGRQRNLIFVEDLSHIIFQLSEKPWEGFHALNVRGQKILIEELVKELIDILNTGVYTKVELPEHLKVIDQGNAHINDGQLRRVLGMFPQKDLKEALRITIDYWKENCK
ncbi:MAG: NAD-dependent epimerase/dehydratase family protein [bacterium]|nr:NAD-dependent epimerase/dehydratase family protein [bacterium]